MTTVSLFSCFLSLLLVNFALAEANECECTPASYKFRIDYSVGCPGNLQNGGPGIVNTTCFVFPDGFGSPETVSVLQINELILPEDGSFPQTVSQKVYDQGLEDQGIISYTPTFEGVTNIIQVIAEGLNANNETLRLSFGVQFTNDCDTFPVLQVGDEMGKLVIVDTTDPSKEKCPAVTTTCSKSGKKSKSDQSDKSLRSKKGKAIASSSKAPKSLKSGKSSHRRSLRMDQRLEERHLGDYEGKIKSKKLKKDKACPEE